MEAHHVPQSDVRVLNIAIPACMITLEYYMTFTKKLQLVQCKQHNADDEDVN